LWGCLFFAYVVRRARWRFLLEKKPLAWGKSKRSERMVEKMVINNVELDVEVVSMDKMNVLYQQDMDMAKGSYKKGNTIVVQFGKSGFTTYSKRLNGRRIVRKVWINGILRSTCVCHI